MHIYASHHLISTHVFVCIQNPGAPISSSTIPSATTILPHPTSFTSSVTSYAPVNDTPITTTTITVAATSTIAATSDERLASTTTNRILQSTVVPTLTTAAPSSSPYKATNSAMTGTTIASNTAPTSNSNNVGTPTKPSLPPTTLASPTVPVPTLTNPTAITTAAKQSSSSSQQRLSPPTPSLAAVTPLNTTPIKQFLSTNIQTTNNTSNSNGVVNTTTEQISQLSVQSVAQGHGAPAQTKVGGSIPVSSTSKISNNSISSSNNNNSNSRVNPYPTSPNHLPPKLNATSSSVTHATSLAPTASPNLQQSSSPATSAAAAVTHQELSDELRSLRYDIHKELQVILREQNRLMELNKVSISRLVAMFRLGLGH